MNRFQLPRQLPSLILTATTIAVLVAVTVSAERLPANDAGGSAESLAGSHDVARQLSRAFVEAAASVCVAGAAWCQHVLRRAPAVRLAGR